jgi:hypothetical protein
MAESAALLVDEVLPEQPMRNLLPESRAPPTSLFA